MVWIKINPKDILKKGLNMKICKILSAFLISAVFSIKVFSCAIVSSPFDMDDYEFNFLDNRLVKEFNDESFLSINNNRHSRYWDRELKDNEELKEANIDEWFIFLNKKFDKKKVEEWIYKKEKLNIQNKEVSQYMRNAQKYQTYVSEWGKKPKLSEVKIAITLLEKEYKNTKSKFIKLRYSFLILRLKHYYGFYNDVINQTYTKNLTDVKSVVFEWIDSLVAGAEKKLKNRIKSSYLFAKIFQNSKTKTHIGFYDFSIKNDMEWNELMDMCKNDDEKSLMYAIRGLKSKANSIEEMENIYNIDVNSKWFDVLLFREMKKLQNRYFIFQNNSTKYNISYFKDDGKKMLSSLLHSNNLKIKSLRKLFDIVLKEKKRKNLFLSKLSNGYLYFLENMIDKAKENIKNLKPNDKIEKNQIKLLIAMMDIVTLKNIDEKIEDKIANNYQNFQKNGFGTKIYLDFITKILPKLYDKNELAKIHILRNRFDIDLINLKKDEYVDIEKLENKKEKTTFDKILLSHYKENNEYIFQKYSKLYIKTVFSLKEGNFEKAKEMLNKMDKKKMPILRYNPFNATSSGTNRKDSKHKKTLLQFVNTFLTISEIVKKEPNKVMDNYLLANAYYNLSSFGNSPMITRFFRSSNSFDKYDYEYIKKATYHYKQALKHTIKPEFQAKILYMLAKCEYKDKRLNQQLDMEKMEEDSEFKEYVKHYGYGKNFDKLRKDYKNTKYYEEVIKECGTFKNYLKVK